MTNKKSLIRMKPLQLLSLISLALIPAHGAVLVNVD